MADIVSIDPKDQSWLRSKWPNKSQMRDVEKVWSFMVTYAMPYKASGCWFSAETSNMTDHWDYCMSEYLMYSDMDNPDEGYSDVRPATVYKNVQAMVASFQSNTLETLVEPQGGGHEKEKTDIIQEIIKGKTKLNNWPQLDNFQFHTFVTKGMVYSMIPWTSEVGEAYFADKQSDLSPEAMALMNNAADITYSKKTYKGYNDFDKIVIPPEEMFVAPTGTRFHMRNNMIGRKVWQRWIGYDEFIHIFAKDPFAINVDRVDPCGSTGLTESTFFPNKDFIPFKNSVRLWFYEDVFNDEIIIIANDILIKKYHLPDQFKGKSIFVDFHFIDLQDHHYTPGLAAMLLSTHEEISTLRNMLYDQAHLDGNPPTYIDSNIAEEFSSSRLRTEPGSLISIQGLAQFPNAIQQPRGNSSGMSQIMNILPILENEVTQIAGFDPRNYGTIQRSGSATEVETNNAASERIMDVAVTNFATGKAIEGDLMVRWIRQKYADPMVDDEGKLMTDGKEPKLRKVMLEGIEITPNNDKEDFALYHKVEKVGWHALDLKKEYIDLEEDPRVIISPQSIQKITKPFKVQQIQNALAQYGQFAGLPGQQAPYGGPAIIDINKMLRSSLDIQELPMEWLFADNDTDKKKALEEANDHVYEIIVKGNPIVGTPGECKEHIDYEYACLRQLQGAILMIKDKMIMENATNPQPPQIDPATGGALPPEGVLGNPDTERHMLLLLQKAKMLEAHIQVESAPAGMPGPTLDALQTMMAPQQPAQQPGQAPQPQGAQMQGSQPAPKGVASQAPMVPPATPMNANMQA